MSKQCTKFHPWSMGLSLGIIWGVSLFIIGLFAMWTGWGKAFVDATSSVYVGFDATWWGSIVGFIWGFIDLFIAGVIFAWLYNYFVGVCCKSSGGE